MVIPQNTTTDSATADIRYDGPVEVTSWAVAPVLAESTALDFLNTSLYSTGRQIDWLGSGAALVDWLQQVQLLSEQEALEVRRMARLEELDTVAAGARQLRDWFRSFVLRYHGQALTGDALHDLAPINDLLRADALHLQIHVRPPPSDVGSTVSPLHGVWKRREISSGALMYVLGEAVAHAIASLSFANIKYCQGRNCSLVFLDKTSRLSRRWCSMATCGNRAKQASHRKKQQKNPPHAS
ncbi:ABATE domain-containing protein [Pseudomonas sp. RC10]|uniref:CGNR zinc finger domain-containing protein n=1 Tax=Pseudomonas bambusae TaxID=3139142 RepID=UPI003139B105